MSDVLARIRVKETHGIRRFLYPLKAEVVLPTSLDYAALGIATRDNDIDMERLCLVTDEGNLFRFKSPTTSESCSASTLPYRSRQARRKNINCGPADLRL